MVGVKLFEHPSTAGLHPQAIQEAIAQLFEPLVLQSQTSVDS